MWLFQEKDQTTAKDSVLQNELAGNCDEVWGVFTKNKTPRKSKNLN